MAAEERNYGTHADFHGRAAGGAGNREHSITSALRQAFARCIRKEEVEVIVFKDLSALELAAAILSFPVLLKPLLAVCNIGGRALARDLGLRSVNTYNPKISKEQAQVLAGYIKPFLPDVLALPAVAFIDRVEFIDKEIRMSKGRWEKDVIGAINKLSDRVFRKRKFENHGDDFEIDAACPVSGDIAFAVDIKRIEARQDIHKRSDEIINKAMKTKEVFPKAKFGAVIYYPFIQEQVNVQDRLRSPFIDSVVFAGETDTSIQNAVRLLLGKFGL